MNDTTSTSGLSWLDQIAQGITSIGGAVNSYEAQRIALQQQQQQPIFSNPFAATGATGSGNNMLMIGLVLVAGVLILKLKK